MLSPLERVRLARDLLAGLGASGAVLDSTAGPLQRARLAARLGVKVAELVALTKPGGASGATGIMQRARLAKEINELLAQMGTAPAVNEHIKTLTDIAEGRKDASDLTTLWALIYDAVDALQEGVAPLTGPDETLAHTAITRWAELEEKTNG